MDLGRMMAEEDDDVSLEQSMSATLSEIRGRDEQIDDDPPDEDLPEDDLPKKELKSEVKTSDDAGDLPETEEDEPPKAEQEDATIANAPQTWTAQAKAQWKELPAWARQEIRRRESDSSRGVQQLKESADFGTQMNQAIQPYLPTIRSKGIQPVQAVETMLNAYHVLETAPRSQKAQVLLETAQQYGCLDDVRAILGGQGMNQQGLTPAQVQQLLDQRLQQEREAQQRQTQEVEDAKIEQEVSEFVGATNEDGSLQYPFVDNVWGDMVGIIQAARSSGRDVSLADAYERAVWANPETRQIVSESQRKEQEAKRQRDAKARAEKAQKANGLNLRKRPSHQGADTPEPTGSVEDTMRKTLEQVKAASG